MADTTFSNGTVVEVDWAQDVNDHAYDKGAVPHHAASRISVTPTGSIAAITVQAALAELDSEKVAASGGSAANLTLTGTTTASGPITVPAGATLDILNKHIYIEEADTLRLTASSNSYIEAVASYEEIS